MGGGRKARFIGRTRSSAVAASDSQEATMTESIITAAAAVAALVAAGGAFYRWGKVEEAISGLQKADERLQASIDQVREDVRELRTILLSQQRSD